MVSHFIYICPLSFPRRLRHIFSILITNGPVGDVSFPRSFISPLVLNSFAKFGKSSRWAFSKRSIKLFSLSFLSARKALNFWRQRGNTKQPNGDRPSIRQGQLLWTAGSVTGRSAASVFALALTRRGSRWWTGGLARCSALARCSSGRRGSQCCLGHGDAIECPL